ISLPTLNDLEFAAWDVYPANAFESAVNAEVLRAKDILPVEDELKAIVPLKAAFDKNYASRLDGDNVKDCATRWEMVEELRKDIRDFKAAHNCDRIVVIWAASTEVYVPVDEQVHGTLAALEAAMKADDREHIAPSMCYAYAALAEGAPFIMGAPNTTVDIPAMWEMAEKTRMPIAGKDFKTGQTLVKSGFAPIIGTRCLGLSGWFSTNILGNRDGLVLDEPANFRTKEVSKLSTLESILVPEEQPDLYTDYYHKVRINYYPPRNDNKEGWDNIDIFGWMGYPMQIKINFLCRDSILAAPLMLDLVLLSDAAARDGRWGIQRFLGFFLKSPMHDYTKDEVPVNHLFQQYVMLKNAIREMGGLEADEEID
ncbi:MAG: inositol-3-phosphate synthase, partial [Bacteroidaceae bacterium]|nr:inositol-3-phosphate synthase [Bacteroidaceae bacterium]